MRDIKQTSLLFVALVFVAGLLVKEEVVGQQVRPNAKETQVAESAPPMDESSPWESPTGLVLIAIQRLEDGERKAPALKKLSLLALAQAQSGNEQDAVATLLQAVEVAREIENPYWRSLALKDSATALAKAGDKKNALVTLQKAVAATQEMESSINKRKSLRFISFALIEVGANEQAVKVIQSADDVYWKAITLAEIALLLTEAGDREQALAILRHSLESAQKIEFEIGKFYVLNKIAETLAVEPVPEHEKINSDRPVVLRMKASFTPEEKQFSKRISIAIYHRS